jgi:glycosyltransferase involved in cell wall biosynthesis
VLTINGRFLTQPTTGVQRYAREIVATLDQLLDELRLRRDPVAANRDDPQWDTRIVSPAGAVLDAPLHMIGLKQTIGHGPIWDQFILPFAAEGVLLSLANKGPLLSRHHIICIHDVSVFLVPESFGTLYRVYSQIMSRLLAKMAEHVVTVSHFSARMLSDLGLCRAEKISVIPNGHEHVRRWRPELSRYAANDAGWRPFIFVLGSRAHHKNVKILLSIAAELDALGLDIVMAGGTNKVFSTIEAQSLPPNVHRLGFVNDDDLAALYRNALCLAFPSLTEGFGLPALEAQALGCPVIASKAGSLPEVCGQAALYADPQSPREWLEQIKRLQSDPGLAKALRQAGPRQAMNYSWSNSARLYLDLVTKMQKRHRANLSSSERREFDTRQSARLEM